MRQNTTDLWVCGPVVSKEMWSRDGAGPWKAWLHRWADLWCELGGPQQKIFEPLDGETVRVARFLLHVLKLVPGDNVFQMMLQALLRHFQRIMWHAALIARLVHRRHLLLLEG